MALMLDQPPDPGSAYRPGVCNIGPEEIARRRRSAVLGTIAAAVIAGGLLALHVPPMARIALWPFAAGAAVGWLQVTRRFCVAFGAMGVLNFGRTGSVVGAPDAAARAADRRTALRMILEGASYGLLVAAAFVLLPV